MAPPPSHSQAVLPGPGTLILERIERSEAEFGIYVRTHGPPHCPACGKLSTSRHSRYVRKLSDVPWQGRLVQLWLSLRKFRCTQSGCRQKVFCERVPGVARPYGRRTERLATVVGAVGHVAGGLPGSRLLERLAIRLSDDSVRREVVRRAPRRQDHEPVRYLGVDDWAWRKHQNYGTILVDLGRHKVVELLSDRSSESVAAWLAHEPSVQLVARDRSGLYADGAAAGAPQARQVADRFHLVLNLSTAIERVLEQRSQALILESSPGGEASAGSATEVPARATLADAQKQQRRQRRRERYQKVRELRDAGYSNLAISRELSISVKTVRRWLRADQFPERKPPRPRRKKVAEFAEYLCERWKAGCHNATKLFVEIRARGYDGSRQMVGAFVSSWRQSGTRQPPSRVVQYVGPKHAAILTTRDPSTLTSEQQLLFTRLFEGCPEVLPLRNIALEFQNAFANRDPAALTKWIEATKRSPFGPLVRFAYGLQKDIEAVRAAVETTASNGQTEGQINRLKAIKRQMYGRAGFAYLRARVLPCSALTALTPARAP